MSLDIKPSVGPQEAPPRFHMLSKPTGAACNLDCKYCFFLSKDALYPNDRLRMPDDVLERYIKQLLESHQTPTVTVAWQGGEPTLMTPRYERDPDQPKVVARKDWYVSPAAPPSTEVRRNPVTPSRRL